MHPPKHRHVARDRSHVVLVLCSAPPSLAATHAAQCVPGWGDADCPDLSLAVDDAPSGWSDRAEHAPSGD